MGWEKAGRTCFTLVAEKYTGTFRCIEIQGQSVSGRLPVQSLRIVLARVQRDSKRPCTITADRAPSVSTEIEIEGSHEFTGARHGLVRSQRTALPSALAGGISRLNIGWDRGLGTDSSSGYWSYREFCTGRLVVVLGGKRQNGRPTSSLPQRAERPECIGIQNFDTGRYSRVLLHR